MEDAMRLHRFFAWFVGVVSIGVGCLAAFAAVSMNEGSELCIVFIDEGRKVDPFSCQLSVLAVLKTFSLYVGVALFYGLIFYLITSVVILLWQRILNRFTKKTQ
ncbi:MAG: hypothetical protein ACRCX5_05475 [Bacteroidales bacterium]